MKPDNSAEHPPCFSAESWALYVQTIDSRKPSYCADCSPERRDQMIAEGRCLHPETFFRRGPDGALVGLRPAKRN